MEGASVLDFKSDVGSQDKPKVEKTTKSSIANSARKTLADISNRPRTSSTSTQDNKSLPNSSTVKEYIEQLQKENAALMKLLADKKIIDISGTELQKLRITLQKMQLQNLHLAQSNSQMLAELNSGKDRLKDLQHQLGCQKGLLIAQKLDLEGKRKTESCERTNEIKKVKVSEHEEMGVCTVAEIGKGQHSNTNGRQKSKSLGPSAQKVQEKGVGDSGRLQARRQSARYKNDEPKPSEDLCYTTDEIEDKLQEDDVVFSVKKEENTSRRSSVSRPSREVAKKVQSYREASLNVKMRRPE